MRVSFRHKQRLAIWQKKYLYFLLPFFILLTSVIALFSTYSPTSAVTSDTLNFQGRLLTGSGALVDDGSYNIEFNLYTVDTGGVSEWTETRLNSGAQGVTVQNGYFSVYLGDVTAFPGTIDWDQEHWLGMTVRGTGSCAFGSCTPTDAEMTPRFKLTAVPYAFRSGAVLDAAGNAFTGDDLVQVAPSTIQALNVAVAALRLNQTGAGGLIQLQGDGSDVFTVDKAGEVTLGAGITVGNSLTTTSGTIRWSGTDLEVYDGTDWVSLTAGGLTPLAATFYDNTGGATVASGVFSTINLDATLENTDNSLLVLASDTVTVQEDGTYAISYEVTSNLASGTRSGFNAKLQLDTGGGFNDVSGSHAYHYGRITTETQGTSSAQIVLTLSAGDVLQIQGQGTTQSFTTVAGATRFTISKVGAGAGGGGGGGGSSFEQSGNAFGTTAILGTTDTEDLNIITDGNTVLSLTVAGAASFTNGLTVGNGLTLSAGNIDLSSGDLLNVGDIAGTAALTISSGGAGDLILDSASDTLVLSDSTLLRSASGATTIDLLDAAGTTSLSLLNSGAGQVADLTVEGDITANAISGDGSGLTLLNGSNITSGTVDDARLTTNVALLNATQTFTALTNFSSAITVGNTADTTAGNIRWTGADLEVFDGTVWVSLTGAGAPVLEGVIAFGKYDGAGGSALNENGATVTRNSVGNYTVTFDTVAGDANYTIQLASEEDITTLDDTKIHYDNYTTAGFDVYIHEGDNGTVADVAVDRTWDFIVFDSSGVAGGGGGGGGSSFVQGGNGFGATALLGTTDANGLDIITNGGAALSFTSDGAATFNNGVTLSSGDLDLSSGDLNNVGNITGSAGVLISSGGVGALTLDSASDVLILSDDTIQRSGTGSTTIDLLDSSASTTLEILNSDGGQVADLTVEGDITATNFFGSGASLSSLNATSIITGTLADTRLTTNVALLDTAQTFTAQPNFSSGLTLGNTALTTAGNIRWTGADFEGFDGTQWVSLTGGGASTALAATFYDNTGGATISSGTFSTINLDATLTNTDNSLLVLAGDTITVQEDGEYAVSYEVSSRLASGTRSGFNAKLQLDTGGGFADVSGSHSYHYGRITTENQGTSSAEVILDLTAGDILRVQGQGTTQSFTTIADATRFTIAKVGNVSGGGGGGGTAFEQGGNSFGAGAILGTTDLFGLDIVTNGAVALAFTNTGAATFNNGVTISSGSLSVDSGVIDASGALSISSGGAGSLTLDSASDVLILADPTLQRVAAGTTTLDLSDSTDTTFAITNSNGSGVADLTVEGSVTAVDFTGIFLGNGAGVTSISGSNIATGTIADNRLSSNVVLLDGAQTFTATPTFNTGLVLGGSTSTSAGAIRWSGTDFEGFDGISWVSLTAPTSAPLLEGVIAFGKYDGAGGSTINVDGATIAKNSTGNYTVTFSTAAADANYTVLLTSLEDSGTLDDVKIHYDNHTTAGFDVYIHEGDNGTVADVFVDRTWDFIVIDASGSAGGGGGGGTSFDQGGNAFTATAVLGTTDAFGISVITDGSLALSFASTGEATFISDLSTDSNLSADGGLTIGTPSTADALAKAIISSDAAANKGLVIQGAASQTASLFQLQDDSGNVLSAFDENGGLVLGRSTATDGTILFNNDTNSNTITLTTSAAAGTRVISLPDENGTICLNGSDNCGFISIGSGTIYADATTNDSLAINKTNATGNLLLLQRSGSAVFTVANNGALQIQATVATALDIKNAGGTSYLTVDTASGTTTIDTLALTNGVSGAGLVDCDGAYDTLQWDIATGLFSCRDDSTQTRSFVDTTSDTLINADGTDYWDTAAENNNSFPNITPSSISYSVLGTVSVEFDTTSNGDRDSVVRVERGIGAAPTCGSGTIVGGKIGVFTSQNTARKTGTITFLDNPATTSDVYYTVCSDADTSNAGGMTIPLIRVTLQETLNSN